VGFPGISNGELTKSELFSLILWPSVGIDPGQTQSVNKVKTIGQKVKVKD
jgi:hypothetical protein